jgi:hypothetical protein
MCPDPTQVSAVLRSRRRLPIQSVKTRVADIVLLAPELGDITWEGALRDQLRKQGPLETDGCQPPNIEEVINGILLNRELVWFCGGRCRWRKAACSFIECGRRTVLIVHGSGSCNVVDFFTCT